MIRAIYRQGAIHPLDAVPAAWRDGVELLVHEAPTAASPEEVDTWAAEMAAVSATIADQDHDKFMAILAVVEAESKELGRRELERSP